LQRENFSYANFLISIMQQEILTATGTITVAIAEDNENWRLNISDKINEMPDCQITVVAVNGKDLLDKMAAIVPLPNVVLLDISMPVLDGYTTLAEIKKRWPAQRVIMLTAYCENFTVAHCLKHGANGFLDKGFFHKNFHCAITAVAGDNYFFSNCITKDKKDIQPPEAVCLSKRELQFLRLNVTEKTLDDIANKMCISPRTVQNLQYNLGKKLNLSDRKELAIFATHVGIIMPHCY